MVDHKYQGEVLLSLANGKFVGPKTDMVDHPPHYNQGTMEAIDMIEAANLNYHLSNALKYLIRSPYKGHEEEDLRKAIWYINRHIDRNINGKQ